MNKAKTRLNVFIHPSLVKKSYLYLGIPPLTNTNNAINNTNLIAKNIENKDVILCKYNKYSIGDIIFEYTV